MERQRRWVAVYHRTAAMTEVAGGVAAVSARLSRVGATGGGSGAGHSMWRNVLYRLCQFNLVK